MKISVVIPSLNAVNHIEAALSSVWAQTYPNFEILVMDGGSHDGTLEILKANAHRIAHIVSEKDSGTTEAMNKGFSLATGDLITFLCSDDRFADQNVFADIARFFKDEPQTDVLCTEIDAFDAEDPTFKMITKSSFNNLHKKMTVHLPGAFFRREALRERQFNSGFEVANDYELFVYLKEVVKARFAILDRVSVIFSMGGRTNNPSTDFLVAKDCFRLRRNYYGYWPALPIFAWDLAVACLRKFKIRPLRWFRYIRRTFFSVPLQS